MQKELPPDKGPNCTVCRSAYSTGVQKDLTKQWVCRAHPPKPNVLLGPQGPINVTLFPLVTDDMICGEFQVRVSTLVL